jgi:hypothetical protein
VRMPMKWVIQLILPLLVYVFGLTIALHKAEAEGGPVNVGYLLDENFSFLFTAPNNIYQPSGWDIQRNGGNVTYSYNNYMKISDTSATLPVTFFHKVLTQTAGTVTLEYRFKPTTIMDGLKWQLRNDTTPSVSIATYNNNLVLETPSGMQVLQTYEPNTEYGVKVIANISTDKADIYVNGALKVSQADFTQATNQINGFWMQTGAVSTGEVIVTPVKIYKGYNVNETFISTMTNVPTDWQTVNTGGLIEVAENKSATRPDIYSLKLDGSGSANGVSISKSFPAQNEDQVFEFKMLIPSKADGLTFELQGDGKSALKLVTANGKLNYINRGGKQVPFYDYQANIWYAIKVKITDKDKAYIYLNGKLLVDKIPSTSKVNGFEQLRFYSPPGTGKLMWVDDVKLYDDQPLPSDYVPAPVAPQSVSYEVGAQSCSMWREGSHLGWDSITPYPDRKPYLGYYDEGNPETADWEIKWMVEHGITFENYCWFRPRGNEGLPIKDPYLGYALHDGYLNAKYSDKMKFIITWENSSSYSKNSEDFRTNVVPYWIEYYFKDPRYLKIDNKPVISIYQLSGMIRDFGNVANAKAEINYLRSAVQAAGFSDVIVITVSNSTEVQKLTDLTSAGFDAAYTYSFGSLESHAELQEQNMVKQKDLGIIDIVPTLSMGRDDTAWSNKPGYWTTPSEFQSLAMWAKNTFIPSLPATSLGKKVVMLDNWNEYGEGHFLMPSGLHGFEYLDALRSTFTTGGNHTDSQPTLAQTNRINVLFPTDRHIPLVWPPLPPALPITTFYSGQWEFNTDGNSQGWSATKQVSDLTVSEGKYSGITTGTDPGIVSADHLGIAAGDAAYLQIGMSTSLGASGQIYFITEADGVWSENKVTRFYVENSGENQIVYNIPMYQVAGWQGTIRQIRIDMLNDLGSFSIDYIRTVDPVEGITPPPNPDPEPTLGPNLVVDSGFEDSTTHYSGYAIQQLLKTTEHHSGAQALQITKTNNYGSFQIPLSIAKGDTYHYSAWAKLNPDSASGKVLRLGIQYKLNGVQKQIIMMTSPGLDTTSWKQVTGNYTINEVGTVTDVAMFIYTDAPAQMDTYFLDDVEVRKVS